MYQLPLDKNNIGKATGLRDIEEIRKQVLTFLTSLGAKVISFQRTPRYLYGCFHFQWCFTIKQDLLMFLIGL